MNDVFVVEIVNESGLTINEQTKGLGRNSYFDKLVLIVCAHPKSKAKIDKTNRYGDILDSFLIKFRVVFPDNLPNGLPPSRKIDYSIKLLPGSKPVSKPAYKLSHSKA